jgi:hypothetical protein
MTDDDLLVVLGLLGDEVPVRRAEFADMTDRFYRDRTGERGPTPWTWRPSVSAGPGHLVIS